MPNVKLKNEKVFFSGILFLLDLINHSIQNEIAIIGKQMLPFLSRG